MQRFSSPEMLEDPHNHCVPLMDVIYDPTDTETCFAVMPFLKYIDYPPFELVEDMLECGEQILEVSSFLRLTDNHSKTVPGSRLLARQ